MTTEKCQACGIAIKEFLTGRRKVGTKIYCKRDYFSLFGDVVEEHPIGSPRRAVRLAQN